MNTEKAMIALGKMMQALARMQAERQKQVDNPTVESVKAYAREKAQALALFEELKHNERS